MVERKYNSPILRPQWKAGRQKKLVPADNLPEQPQVTAQEIDVIESYLGQFLSMLLEGKLPDDCFSHGLPPGRDEA